MDNDYLVLQNGCKRDSWILQILTKEHIDSLEQFFQHNRIPRGNEMRSIAAHLNISYSYVRTWFRYRLYGDLALRHRRRYMPRIAA
ncbi:unnamed protein product [Rotaria sordida]|uniref:Homeobox domain-containing protein n=1 Tax=Rotaria sordida TaxID=392033 RepID=A0A819VLY6_9BILA|nr:unnamed protein product [Rotaria sordida]CAF1369180.1 unnamed protein product [Rotaria sordida]CAF1610815.1 unnamed protein product [Rotaria sordida]CAF4110124.1 unnamed protein product [Rotaria sordida]